VSTPSTYQQAIYDFVESGRGDGAVDAVAGSGKTTTLIEVSKRLHTSNALFLAFNKHIVNELRTRLGTGVKCKTLNALGHAAIANALKKRDVAVSLDNFKYDRIVTELLGEMDIPRQPESLFSDCRKAMCDLVALAQSSLVDTNDGSALLALAAQYNVDIPEILSASSVHAIVTTALETGIQLGRQGVISFDDQIWLPVKFRMRPEAADFVLVDEAQDLSPAKLELALAARAPGGRMLFVGDPAQAIYGFAGADCDSFANIVKRTNAAVLPLSVCYRCPTSVVAQARTIVPQIEAAPGAPAGEVVQVNPNDVVSLVRTGDLILCRLTAPLVKMCIKMIGARMPARVRGRDIGKDIVKVTTVALGRLAWDDVDDALEFYLLKKRATLAKRSHSENKIAALEDTVAAIRAIIEGFGSTSLEEFAQQVDSLFGDGKAAIELSTVHRAKGLEADRVFIIEPEVLPLSWEGQLPWEARQEMNLRYVAITRARQALFIAGVLPPIAPKLPVPATHDEFIQQLPERFGIEPMPALPTGSMIAKVPERFSCSCYLCEAAFIATTRERVCRACGAAAVRVKLIEGKFSDTPCDGRCHSAHGHECICSCGGANHGKTWLTGFAHARQEALPL
jgi:DNA helicase-2/ATP-dependent DNA helicase PcrA